MEETIMKKIWVLVLALLMVFSCTAGLAEDWMTPYEETIDIHIACVEPANAIFPEGQDYFEISGGDFSVSSTMLTSLSTGLPTAISIPRR